MRFYKTPAGYHVPVLPSKPKKGDVRYFLYYGPGGHEQIYTRTFNGNIWL